MNQERHEMMKKNNQNWKNIYVLPFKTMVIIASCSFFIHMNVKEYNFHQFTICLKGGEI
jgi:hypothetical protein